MMQILLHLWGDYIFQNHWMAVTKVKNTIHGYLACLLHCMLYSLPFLLVASPLSVLVIFVTHFIIDKWRIAFWVVKGKNLWFGDISAFPPGTPDFISAWIIIIVDNILHVTINYCCIK
jgi:hypothetical protein